MPPHEEDKTAKASAVPKHAVPEAFDNYPNGSPSDFAAEYIFLMG